MYSSWFKNDPHEDDPGEIEHSSNSGTIWFASLLITSFALVGIAIFFPDPGILIALCGLPIAAVIHVLWLLRLLRVL